MKKTILSIALAVLTIGAAAQKTDSTRVENDTTLAISGTLTKPQFPGGQKALTKFISKKMKYPDTAAAYDIEGSVVMAFFVNEDGSLSDISAHDCTIDRFNTTKFSQETEARQNELKKQFALMFAKEGARVFRMMPKWTPGCLNGKPVRVKMNQRIKFVDPNK